MAKALLGISPGTRVIGLAVIINGELLEWKVKSFKEKWCAEKQTAIISVINQLIEHYEVKIVSVKKIDPLKSSQQLDSVIRSIEKLVLKKHVTLIRYSLSELDYNERSNKKDGKARLTERIVEKHPELKKEYFKERNNRTEYYTKMFEAVALAERCREW